MLIGGLLTSMTAWLVERRFHRWFSARPLMTGGLVLLFLTGLSLSIYAPLEARLRTLLWPPQQTEQSRPPAPSEPACTQEPPTDQRSRILWEQECR
jgi:hypothetical protein